MNKEEFIPKKENKVQRTFTIEQYQDDGLDTLMEMWDCSKSDAIRVVLEKGFCHLREVHSIKL